MYTTAIGQFTGESVAFTNYDPNLSVNEQLKIVPNTCYVLNQSFHSRKSHFTQPPTCVISDMSICGTIYHINTSI